jgi:hypothetical protein
MNESDWLEVAARMSRLWPNMPIQDDTAAEWYLLLQDLPTEAVNAAVTTVAVVGERFPPPAGVLRAKAAEIACDDGVTWAEVSAELDRMISRYGCHREVPEEDWSSTTVADLVRLVGWQHVCLDVDPPGVRQAQLRGKWQELRARELREKALDGLLSPAQRKAIREGSMTTVAKVLEERGDHDD